MMRGPELAGARDRPRRATATLADGTVRVHVPRRRAGRGRRSTSRPPSEELLALGEAGATISHPPARARRCSEVVVAAGAVPGLRLAHVPSGRGRRARRTAVARRGPRARATSTSAVEVDPDDGTLTDRPPTACTVAGAQPLRRRRRRRRHLQLLAARRRHRRRPARVGRRRRSTSRARCAARVVVDRDVPVAGARDRRRAVVLARAATTRVATEVVHHARAAHRRAVPARARRARPPRARPPAAGALPAARAGRRLRRRVRVRGRAPRAHRRGRPARVRPPHVRVPPVRRLLGDGDVGPRAACTTGCSSTRCVDDGHRARAHAAARHRLPLRARSRRCGPTRPVRSTRSRARSCRAALALEYAVAPAPGRRARLPTCPRSPTMLVPLERVRGGGWPGAPAPARAARSTSTAPRCRRSCATTPARSCVRVVNRTPAAADRRGRRVDGAPVAGDVVDLTGAELDALRRVGRAPTVGAAHAPPRRRLTPIGVVSRAHGGERERGAPHRALRSTTTSGRARAP